MTPPPGPSPHGGASVGPLAQSVGEALRALRAALFDLYREVGADPSAPQEVSRRYGVTKSQAWKIAKILQATDPLDAARYLPGMRGMERVLEALAGHGASAPQVERARQAMAGVHEVIRTHAGDRATFDRTLDSLRADGNDPSSMEASRRLAFLGNSATWGIQARMRLTLRVLTPSAVRPGMLDIGNVSGLLDLHRLRPTTRWPLGQHYYSKKRRGQETPLPPGEMDVEPLIPSQEGPEGAPFLEEFCSHPLPPVRKVERGQGIVLELDEGPVGKAASLSSVFGLRYTGLATMYASEAGKVAENCALLRTPSEVAITDLLVHKDVPMGSEPTARLYSNMEAEVHLGDIASRSELPLAEPVEFLGSGPPLMATPHYDRYEELVVRVVEAMGGGLEEYSAWRVVQRYPPIPTMLSVQFELATRG